MHGVPSLLGFCRFWLRHPVFATSLLRARATYFFSRRLFKSLATPDGYLIETPSQLISYWSMFIERELWDASWVRAVVRESKPVVLDVGANAGLFSHMIWTLNPNAQLIAFEPLPEMAVRIRAWQQRTKSNLICHNQAVSSTRGTATLYASQSDDPTASLVHDGTRQVGITVPVTTLDASIEPRGITLIKVDVEGLECEVLAGGKHIVSNAQFLLLEAHTKQSLQNICRQLGDSWQCKRVGTSDYLFTRAGE
jgi:FkbM family methyltransferase